MDGINQSIYIYIGIAMTKRKSKQKSKKLTSEMEYGLTADNEATVTKSKTMKKDQESPDVLYNKGESQSVCPSCKTTGDNFIIEGRCITCTKCGWSKCAW